MGMNVIQAPNKNTIEIAKGVPKVFLAGCANTDWRKEFVTKFEDKFVVFFDPKRDDWNLMDASKTLEQITWEFKHLRDADIIVYHFNAGSVCPITLLEYGFWGLAYGRPIVVYVSDEYEKRRDIIIQTALARSDVKIITTEDEFVTKTREVIEDWTNEQR